MVRLVVRNRLSATLLLEATVTTLHARAFWWSLKSQLSVLRPSNKLTWFHKDVPCEPFAICHLADCLMDDGCPLEDGRLAPLAANLDLQHHFADLDESGAVELTVVVSRKLTDDDLQALALALLRGREADALWDPEAVRGHCEWRWLMLATGLSGSAVADDERALQVVLSQDPSFARFFTVKEQEPSSKRRRTEQSGPDVDSGASAPCFSTLAPLAG
jgi:hypothetical protein